MARAKSGQPSKRYVASNPESRLAKLIPAAREDLGTYVALCLRTKDNEPIEAEAGGFHDDLFELLNTLGKRTESERALKLVGHRRLQNLNVNCPPGIGKTTLAVVGFSAWMLGRNPRLQIGFGSHKADLAERFSVAIRTLMESPVHATIFPDARPSRREKWAANEWKLAGAPGMSFTAFGAKAEIIGTRFDLLVLDDICDKEAASSPTQRRKLSETIRLRLHRSAKMDHLCSPEVDRVRGRDQ